MLPPVVLWTPIEILVNVILQKYYTTSYCVTVVSDTLLNINYSYHYVNIAPKDNLISQILDASEMGCSDYIVHVRDPFKFMVAFENVTHQGIVRRSDKKLLFLPFEDTNADDLLAVLKMKETSYVRHVLLVIPSKIEDHEAFDLVTHKFVGDNAHSQDPVVLDQWDIQQQKFLKDAILFPHDMANLQGKQVKIACFTYPPYIILDIDRNIKSSGRDGLEDRVMEEFCRWINCTIEVVRDDHEWGLIYKNHTGNGVYGNVLEDRADFGTSAAYPMYEDYVELDLSSEMCFTSIICLVPAPKLLVNWQTHLQPFTKSMWLTLAVTYVFASFALSLAQGFKTNNIFLQTFAMMTTQATSDSEGNWRLRSVTAWLLVTGLVLDNAYSGGLASAFMVNKYEPSIDTIKDLVDRKLEWSTTSISWVIPLYPPPDKIISNLIDLFRVNTEEELERRSAEGTIALAVEKLQAGHFALREYMTEKALANTMLMREDLFFDNTVVLMRKSSPYRDKLNILIGRLHNSGLLSALELQVSLKYLNNKLQLQVFLSRSKPEDVLHPLNLSQFTGIFMFYGGGILTATVTFVFEYFYGRKK